MSRIVTASNNTADCQINTMFQAILRNNLFLSIGNLSGSNCAADVEFYERLIHFQSASNNTADRAPQDGENLSDETLLHNTITLHMPRKNPIFPSPHYIAPGTLHLSDPFDFQYGGETYERRNIYNSPFYILTREETVPDLPVPRFHFHVFSSAGVLQTSHLKSAKEQLSLRNVNGILYRRTVNQFLLETGLRTQEQIDARISTHRSAGQKKRVRDAGAKVSKARFREMNKASYKKRKLNSEEENEEAFRSFQQDCRERGVSFLPCISHDPSYLVTSEGEIFSKKSGKFLSLQTDLNGYKRVQLTIPTEEGGTKSPLFSVHRLVAQYHLNNALAIPEELEVDHGDNNTGNNTVSNLSIVTHRENMANRTINGRTRVDSPGSSTKFLPFKDSMGLFGWSDPALSIGNHGDIRLNGRDLPQYFNNGYHFVYYYNGTKLRTPQVHKLVASEYATYHHYQVEEGMSSEFSVDHVNGVKSCNRSDNLDITTPQINSARQGGRPTNVGARNYNAIKQAARRENVAATTLRRQAKHGANNFMLPHENLEEVRDNHVEM